MLAAIRRRLRLQGPVGERQPNRPDDVATVESMVRATGDLPFRRDRAPNAERQVEEDRQRFEAALARLRETEVSDATLMAEIASAAASIGASLARRNVPAATTEAIGLVGRIFGSDAELDAASEGLDQAAENLSQSLERRDDIKSEIDALDAERTRLGCSSIGF
ncbi:MAG: hypothetical protein ACREH3_11780 [Geminicoccales bacterium]